MVTSETMEIDDAGRTTHCSPLLYKVPSVTSVPRTLNVTLLKNHDIKTAVYSSKVTLRDL